MGGRETDMAFWGNNEEYIIWPSFPIDDFCPLV